MNIAAAIIIALVAYAAYRLAQDYVRRSQRSFGNASIAWVRLNEMGREIATSDKTSEAVAKVVLGLMLAAGCGCFVRGILISHYLPRAIVMRGGRDDEWDGAFEEIEEMDASDRAAFVQFLMQVVLYDSFRNPLQGWLFRRAIRMRGRLVPPPENRYEAQIVASSILRRRGLQTV